MSNYKKRLPDKIYLLPDAYRDERTTTNVFQGGRPISAGLPNFGIDLLKWIKLKLLGNRYDAGNGVWVLATETGVTATKVDGIITINVPTDTELLGVDIVGTSTDVSLDNSISVVITYDWNNNANLSKENIMYVNPVIWEITDSDPDDGVNAYRQILTDPPERRITLVGSNSVTFNFTDMHFFDNWAISIVV